MAIKFNGGRGAIICDICRIIIIEDLTKEEIENKSIYYDKDTKMDYCDKHKFIAKCTKFERERYIKKYRRGE